MFGLGSSHYPVYSVADSQLNNFMASNSAAAAAAAAATLAPGNESGGGGAGLSFIGGADAAAVAVSSAGIDAATAGGVEGVVGVGRLSGGVIDSNVGVSTFGSCDALDALLDQQQQQRRQHYQQQYKQHPQQHQQQELPVFVSKDELDGRDRRYSTLPRAFHLGLDQTQNGTSSMQNQDRRFQVRSFSISQILLSCVCLFFLL